MDKKSTWWLDDANEVAGLGELGADVRLRRLEAVAAAARALVPDLQHMRSTNAALRLLILELDALDKEKRDGNPTVP